MEAKSRPRLRSRSVGSRDDFKWTRSVSEKFRGMRSSALGRLGRSYRQRRIQEIEAVESCRWLRAAGFPQYAQMYEDRQFPVDINAVQHDHDFLDTDSIQSLFRRLNTLNKCATMKIDAPPPRPLTEDSDEDDQCAISDKWQYQRTSRRWSRRDLDLDLIPQLPARMTLPSSSSQDSALSDNELSRSPLENSPMYSDRSHGVELCIQELSPGGRPLPTSPGPGSDASDHSGAHVPPPSPSFRRAASEKIKGSAKVFFKRMESLKGRNKPRSKRRPGLKVEIGEPVLVETEQVERRMGELGCVDISPTSPNSGLDNMLHSQQQHNQQLRAESDCDTSPPTPHRSPLTPLSVDTDLHPLRASRDRAVSNGSVQTTFNNGQKFRTGSFSGESRSHQPVTRRTSAPEEVFEERTNQKRRSVYDNLQEVDAQKELDRILDELYANISGLDESLQNQECNIPAKFPTDSVEVSSSEAKLDVTQRHSASSLTAATPHNIPLSRAQSDPPSLLTKGHKGVMINGVTLDLDPDLLIDPCCDEEEVGGSERERRDSGVGSSLTRMPCDRKRQKLRWHSFIKSHRHSTSSSGVHVESLSAGQLMVLRKLSLLKVTAMMEKYSPSNRSGWNWMMPKFIKRWKIPDYSSRRVFGVPLSVVCQRSGQPLPQCILRAMRCLRRNAHDAVGIFRKSGVRSRIQKLRNQLESEPDLVDFDALQMYDVADVLKQYYRELPECLLTNKMSDTFISIFTHMPEDARQDALQAAVLLLADEHRQVLQSLLFFLSDVAAHSNNNQMTASNLAVCFAPSLFNLGSSTGLGGGPTASPRRSRKSQNGLPDQRELQQQKSAHQCLAHLIKHCKALFQVSEEALNNCHLPSLDLHDESPLEDVFRDNTSHGVILDYVHNAARALQKESRDRWRGWSAFSASTDVFQETELSYRKPADGQTLRLWKAAIEVEAPPEEVLNRLLNERHIWDEDLTQWKSVDKVDHQTDVFHYVTASMAPLPSRDICELRSWRTGMTKGACVLVSVSVDHPAAPVRDSVRVSALASHYLIEPCGSGRSRLTYICRIDLRGHCVEWYNQTYGYICARHVTRIRDSFHQPAAMKAAPETKV